MQTLAATLFYLSTVVAAITTLLLGVTFTRLERKRFPFVQHLDKARLLLLISAVLGTLMTPLLQDWREAMANANTLRSIQEAISRLGPQAGKPLDKLDLATAQFTALSIILGTERFGEGRYREALQQYLAADPYLISASLKAKIADCYFQLAEYESAILYEGQAIDLAPDWSGPPYVLAHSYYRLGRIADALAAAKRSCFLGFDKACELATLIENRDR